MIQLTKKILLAACSVAGLLTLSGCGGSDDVAPPGLAQTITFISPGNQNLLQAPPALVANSTSGLPVVFASTTPSVCTVSGTTLTLVSVGSCTVGAAQLGDATYAAAPVVSNTFTVSVLLTAQTITFDSPGNQTFGVAPAPLVATSTSGLTVAFASTTPSVCTASGTTLTLLSAGSCEVAASQAGNSIGNPRYSAAPIVTNTITVAPGTQTITFISPGNQTLGTPPAALSATASSGLTVTFASTTPGICTVSGTALTLVAAGSCVVNASQAGDANWTAAPTVSQSFTVSAAPLLAQTITFSSPGNQTLGTAPAALAATSTSGLTVAFASTTAGVCTASGTTLTLVAVGNCTIVASQAGNGTYAAATPVSNTFAVAAAVATINAFANGGFEAAATLPNEFAASWRGTSLNTTRTNAEAHSGSWSALLALPDPGFGGTGLFQNSVEQGLLIPISAANWGTSPTLSFWLKGNSSETGSLTYALRYLDAIGNILNTAGGSSGSKSIWTGNSIRGWTLFTRTPNTAIPNGTTAVFLEMTLAVGPTGVQPPGNCGVDPITGLPNPCDYGQAQVYLDDVNLQVLP